MVSWEKSNRILFLLSCWKSVLLNYFFLNSLSLLFHSSNIINLGTQILVYIVVTFPITVSKYWTRSTWMKQWLYLLAFGVDAVDHRGEGMMQGCLQLWRLENKSKGKWSRDGLGSGANHKPRCLLLMVHVLQWGSTSLSVYNLTKQHWQVQTKCSIRPSRLGETLHIQMRQYLPYCELRGLQYVFWH